MVNRARKGADFEREVMRLFRDDGWETEKHILSRGVYDCKAWRSDKPLVYLVRMLNNLLVFNDYTVTLNDTKNLTDMKFLARKDNGRSDKRIYYNTIAEEGKLMILMQMKNNKSRKKKVK